MNEWETVSAFEPKPKNIGHVLRVWRAERGLTQKDVAEKLGISAQQFQKYESGVSGIELSRMFEICRIFGKSPSEFLGIDQPAGKITGSPGATAAATENDGMSAIQVDLSFEISEIISEFLSIRKPEDKALALQLVRSIARR